MEFMKYFRRALPVVMLAFTAVFCCGYHSCDKEEVHMYFDPDSWEEMQLPPKYVVSLHEVIRSRTGEGVERTVASYFGDEVTIHSMQLIDSSEITNIQPVPIPGDQGFYNLRFDLTDRGHKLWINLSVQHKGTQLAFVIDGTVYRGFVPRMLDDDADMDVIVDGPFDQATAMALQNNSKYNYFKMRK